LADSAPPEGFLNLLARVHPGRLAGVRLDEGLGAGRLTADESRDRPLRGIVFCVLGLMAFAVQDVIIKLLSSTYSIWQLAFVRAVVVLGIMCPILSVSVGLEGYATRRLGLQLARGALGVSSYTTYYFAVSSLPLVDASAIYASAPLFVTLFSALFLSEAVGVRRWAAVGAGFVGVVVMLRPGVGVFHIAALFSLLSAALYAYSTTVTRRLGTTESALRITLYSNAVYFVVSGLLLLSLELIRPRGLETPAAVFFLQPWQVPSLLELAVMLFSGVLAAAGFFCLAQAYRVSPVSKVAPFEYTYILWALLLGFLVWQHLPSLFTCIGGAIVIASGVYIIHREAVRTRAALGKPTADARRRPEASPRRAG
jgi:drug/metabolite transporter (DMT)-like permease